MADMIADLYAKITARDESGKGVSSAERRFSELAKKAEGAGKRASSAMAQAAAAAKKVNSQAANDDEQNDKRRTRSMLSYARSFKSAFSSVEQAGSRAFGSRSITGGIGQAISRTGNSLGIFRSALGEVGEGAAAAEVGMAGLAAGIGMVAGAAIVGVVAAQKFGAAWAKATTQVGRMAQVAGVDSQTLQAFGEVNKRMGGSKEGGMQAVTGIAKAMNAGIYGDVQVREVARRSGIHLRRNKDGSAKVDDATIVDIATAMSKRNVAGKQLIASTFGISEDALPAFMLGAKALSAQMADVKQHANVQSDAAIGDAERVTGKTATLGQIKDREMANGGRLAAVGTEGLLDGEISAAKIFAKTVDGSFASATKTMGEASKSFSDAVNIFADANTPFLEKAAKAVNRFVLPAPGTGAGATVRRMVSDMFGGDLASRIEHLGEKSRQNQVSPKGAVGVMQLMPQTAMGIAKQAGIPWDESRYHKDEEYNRTLGRLYVRKLQVKYHGDEMLAAAAYNAGEGSVDKWIKRNGDPRTGQISDGDFASKIPFKETRDYVGRVTPVAVHLKVEGLPKGTKVTTKSDQGAVSHAMAN